MKIRLLVTNKTAKIQEVVLFTDITVIDKVPTKNGSDISITMADTYSYDDFKKIWREQRGTVTNFKTSRLFDWRVRTSGITGMYVEIVSPKKFRTDVATCVYFNLPANTEVEIEFEFEPQTAIKI